MIALVVVSSNRLMTIVSKYESREIFFVFNELQVKPVAVVIRSCLVKIYAVFEAISVVGVAVSVCKALVFDYSVSNLVSNEAISVV